MSSDWSVRGVHLSDGNTPVLIAGIDAYATTGWSLGVAPVRLRDRSGQWAEAWLLRAGHEVALDMHWLLLAELQHKHYTRSRALKGWGGTQFALGIAHGDRWSLTWNADQPRDARLVSRSLDVNLRWPLAPQLALTGGLGRVVRPPGARYSYGQAGLEGRVGEWRLRLDRTWAGSAAERSFGSLAAPRWVASAQWVF
jgi:hypothetical protein